MGYIFGHLYKTYMLYKNKHANDDENNNVHFKLY